MPPYRVDKVQRCTFKDTAQVTSGSCLNVLFLQYIEYILSVYTTCWLWDVQFRYFLRPNDYWQILRKHDWSNQDFLSNYILCATLGSLTWCYLKPKNLFFFYLSLVICVCHSWRGSPVLVWQSMKCSQGNILSLWHCSPTLDH